MATDTERCRILVGDCRAVLPTLEAGLITAILCRIDEMCETTWGNLSKVFPQALTLNLKRDSIGGRESRIGISLGLRLNTWKSVAALKTLLSKWALLATRFFFGLANTEFLDGTHLRYELSRSGELQPEKRIRCLVGEESSIQIGKAVSHRLDNWFMLILDGKSFAEQSGNVMDAADFANQRLIPKFIISILFRKRHCLSLISATSYSFAKSVIQRCWEKRNDGNESFCGFWERRLKYGVGSIADHLRRCVGSLENASRE
jgi:hypothetical protein